MSYQVGNNSDLPIKGTQYDPAIGIQPSSGWLVLTFTNDSIASSNLDDPAQPLEASTPILPRSSAYQILMAVEEKKHEMIIKMLDQWNESIQEEAERRRRELSSPEYAQWLKDHSASAIGEADRRSAVAKGATTGDTAAFISSLPIDLPLNHTVDYAFHGSLSAALTNISEAGQLATKDLQKLNNITTFQVAAAPNAVGNLQPTEFLLPSLIMSASAMPLFQLGAGPSGLQLEANTFKNAWQALTPETASASITMAVGGWFSALWGIGLIYKLTADNLTQAAAAKEPPRDQQHIDFAKTYASKLLNSLRDESFQRILHSMAQQSQKASGEKLTPQELKSLEVKSRITLLATALALVAKLEVGSKDYEGYMSDEIFKALIDGKTNVNHLDIFDSSDIKHQLVSALQEQLQQIPAEAPEVRENLLAYMSTNPSIEELIDQQGIVNELFSSSDEGALSRQPGVDTPA